MEVQRQTILVIDDEPDNIAILSNLLHPFYRVRACKSGQQALAVLSTSPLPDLILLDVIMPEIDGYAVLSDLRKQPACRDIPVIFVTALDGDVDVELGLQLGAVDYIAKPIKPAILLARVRTHLEMKLARDRLRDQNAWLEAEIARRACENAVGQDACMMVILGLAETRLSDAGKHILRSRMYVQALARRLQTHPAFRAELDDRAVACIVRAAPLHDIGKLGIPDSVLFKPGGLSPEEWEIMKTHTTLGGEYIRRAMDFARRLNDDSGQCNSSDSLQVLKTAETIAMSHHEKWDGSGYPEGLAGAAIPVAARLMAVADVFDVLTSAREYKLPWDASDAAEAILGQRGSHFDPDVADAFEDLLDEFVKIGGLHDEK